MLPFQVLDKELNQKVQIPNIKRKRECIDERV